MYMEMCSSEREELKIRFWELKAEKFKAMDRNSAEILNT